MFQAYLPALVIGAAGSSVIHLSKGFMKLGQVKKGQSLGRLWFFLGVALNFSTPFWILWANLFAPPVYFTSMYGSGLVALLIFSALVLNESLSASKMAGALFVSFGTLALGLVRLGYPLPPLVGANPWPLVSFAALWISAFLLVMALGRGLGTGAQEFLFGLFGGVLAALDVFLKGLAQSTTGEAAFFPKSPLGWFLLLLSLVAAAGAFGAIQWSFRRQCRVAIMGTVYTLFYVIAPYGILFLTGQSLGGREAWLANLAGLLVLAPGIVLLSWKKTTQVAPILSPKGVNP